MIEWAKDHTQLKKELEKERELLVLFFYAGFSENARRALKEVKEFSRENKKIPVYVIDVEKIKGIHNQFGVSNVPTVLALREGKARERIEGVEGARFYSRVFSGESAILRKGPGKAMPHRVVVYSGPGCPACGTAKAYLRKRGISFRTVDIAQDQRAAENLVKRSGQMAVPQIDIDGRLVVGFDQAKIERLLSN